ncbi:MAG: LacI family DNA-binding transcriptional regulator [Edaphobacter sp.]|jgi:LacI family transcriptional regulator
MTIRLKDIAHDLNVSVITVSKALRGAKDIGEATRQRVLKRMKELDYQPNMTARTLATGRSCIVGLIVPDLLNPFFNELAKYLGGALRKQSYGLIVASSEESPDVERSEIRMMLARGIDALLLASCQPTLQGFYSLHQRITPLVLIDRPFPQLRANFVGTDDCAGGKLATEHLIQLGRKRLAYIGSPDLSPAADRFRGFRNALRDHDIELRQDFIIASTRADEAADQSGYEMMQMLLKRRSYPNGVFCHNDVIAIGAMKATLDAGLSIPKDIAFVGFDNVRYSKYLQIPLTSVDQSTGKLAEAAAHLALDLVACNVEEPRNILLAPTLFVRQSSVGQLPPVVLRNERQMVTPAKSFKQFPPAKKQTSQAKKRMSPSSSSK